MTDAPGRVACPGPGQEVVDDGEVLRAQEPPRAVEEIAHATLADLSYHRILALALTRFPLISSDIIGRPRSAIVDATSTLVMGDRRGKVVALHDNEWGYACRVADVVRWMGAGLAGGPAA